MLDFADSLIDVFVLFNVLKVFEHLGALFLVECVSGVEYASNCITEDANPHKVLYVHGVAYTDEEYASCLKDEEEILEDGVGGVEAFAFFEYAV